MYQRNKQITTIAGYNLSFINSNTKWRDYKIASVQNWGSSKVL